MRIAWLFLVLGISAVSAPAQVTHYRVTLRADLVHQTLQGVETMEFAHDTGSVTWTKQPGLQVSAIGSTDGNATVGTDTVSLPLLHGGRHRLHVQYTAVPARGITWFPQQAGFDTEFYCESWMVCDDSPGQRATLTLEIILPKASGLRVVGPGGLKKQWSDAKNMLFLFEQSVPVQTYLFSFGAAKLHPATEGKFTLYTPDPEAHPTAFALTADAYKFLRSKAGVDFADNAYVQAFMPHPIEQEAAGFVLMPATYLPKLEQQDRVLDMSHELAHQWWGVLVGIRSWSDFWLNEGMATFMSDAYLEHRQGRGAYDQEMTLTRQRMEMLHAQGKDRPLHWEAWKDAHDALGRLPYVKGALFLDGLRTKLGEERFWAGIALYASRNAGRLVDSRDFEQAMEQASGLDLAALFDEAVYH